VAPGAPAVVVIEAADGSAVRWIDVEARTLDAILEEVGAPAPDFVAIDVEGHERSVLRGFDLARWRPRVVLLVRKGAFPPARIAFHMARSGYTFGLRTGTTDWYFAAPPGAGRARLIARALGRCALGSCSAAAKLALRPVVRLLRPS
jgi:hypothetical protein